MYDEMEFILDDFDTDSTGVLNYWYDGAYEEVVDIIEQFTEDDWRKLLEEYPKKSDIWKERLVYCFVEPDNHYQFHVLADLLRTNNVQLFFMAAQILICSKFDIAKLEHKDEIIRKIDSMLPLPPTDQLKEETLNAFKNKLLALLDTDPT